MLAKINQAGLNTNIGEPSSGQIVIELDTTIAPGYSNVVTQYLPSGIMSCPTTTQVANIEVQAQTQMQVLGYNNTIIDANYIINPGEITLYSSNWYNSTRISGIEMQQANTINIEHAVMGQSTNAVLLDIMNLLVEIINYLESIENTFNEHLHTGVSSGTDNSGIPTTEFNNPPSDTVVNNDIPYISGNKNLAITGIYQPYN